MKVCILGSGNGGLACAFDFASHGHEVRLFDFEDFSAQVAAVAVQGGIRSDGDLKGFAGVAYAGHDLGVAASDAELLMIVGPAYSTEAFGAACRPHLREGQTMVVCPGSCGGSLAFKKAAGLRIDDETVTVAETSTLPYAVRVTTPGAIHVYLKLKGGLFLAAAPSTLTGRALRMLRDVFPIIRPAANVLRTALQNGNPIIHPPITLLNAARIERTAGQFLFYEEGVTECVGRLIEDLDRERLRIGRALGFDVIPDPKLGVMQGYSGDDSYVGGYAHAKGFEGINAPPRLEYRYFHEDVGYGLVFMADLGRRIGVATPVMDAVITMIGTLMRRDYRGERARTVEGLGLSGRTARDLLEEL